MTESDIRKKILDEVVAFLNERAEQLYNLGGVHLRESVALGEAAQMIKQGLVLKE